jgi:hypothetical protein
MNDNLRWKIVLGCALIAALEIPQGLSLVLQDLSGPYTHAVDAAPQSAEAAQIPRERHPTLVTMVHPWLAVPTVWSDLRGNSFDLERSTTALALGR